MRNLSMDAAPVVTVILAALVSAWPAYAILLRAKHGRARSAIGYLVGFFAGLGVTAVLAALIAPLAAEATPVPVAGLLASFIGPFIGLLHAKLRGPPRRGARAGFDASSRRLAMR